MMVTISDTLAVVKDTISTAGDQVLEQDSVTQALKDSIQNDTAGSCSNSPADILGGVMDSCYYVSPFNLKSEPSDSTYKSFIPVLGNGEFGVPVSNNTLLGSDLISSLIFICLILAMSVYSASHNFLGIQTKKFFGKLSERGVFTGDSVNENKLYLYFVLQSCLIFSIVTYIFATSIIDIGRLPFAPQLIIPAALLLFIVYFLIKMFLYVLSDGIFDGNSKTKMTHNENLCYITTMEGILLFPPLIMAISTGIDMNVFIIYVAIVIALAKLAAFYNAINTFSSGYKAFLQIILYFCALEVVPLLSLYGITVMTVNYF